MSGTTRNPWAAYEEVTPARPVAQDPWAAFEEVKPEPPSRWGGTAVDIAQQAARGATFGFGDELAAGVTATVSPLVGTGGTWQERYDQQLAANRGRQKEFEAEAPLTALGAQFAGAVANPVTRLSKGANFISRMGYNALINGLLGGVTGFGEGEGGFVNRMGPAATGAATGAVLGAAVPALGEGAAKVARTVAPALGVNVAGTDAQRKIIEALRAGGGTLDDVKTQLDGATGQPLALADVGGEDILGLAQYVARKPGPAMVAAKEFVDQRGGLNQSMRLTDRIDRAISTGDWKSTVDDLIATRERTAGPLYDAVRNDPTPVNVQPILDDINARIETAKGPIRDALRRARALFLNRDGAPDTTLAGLHETKIALDGIMDWNATKPIDTFARREVKQVQRQLLAEMDAASGGKYAAARDAFAGPTRARKAMDLGKSLLSGKDFDETADAIAKLSASEKDFFRIGVARALDDAVKGTVDTHDISKMRKIWGSQTVRERVAAAFDDPAEFDKFAKFMDTEMNITGTNAAVNPRGNSITQKLAMRDAEPAPVGPVVNALRSFARGDAMGFAGSLMPRGTQPGSISAETAAEVAPYLYSLKAGDRAKLIDALIARDARDTKVGKIANPLANALMRGGTVSAVEFQNRLPQSQRP